MADTPTPVWGPQTQMCPVYMCIEMGPNQPGVAEGTLDENSGQASPLWALVSPYVQ